MNKASKQKNHSDDWGRFRLNRKQFNELKNREKLELLCQLGHLAASSHNTQPWKFYIDEAGMKLVLYLDKKLVLSVSDINGRQAVVSLGCALENIIVAAAYYGLKTQATVENLKNKQVLPRLKSNDQRYVKAVEINFKSSNKEPGEVDKKLFDAIFSRKIMRAEFDGTIQLPKDLQSKLQQIAKERGVELKAVTDPIRRLALAEFQSQADGYVINTKDFSRELGQWLLPNSSVSGLGMPGIGFGLKDEQALRLHRGLSGMTPLEPEDGLRFALGGKIMIEKSPFIGLITVDKDTPQQWVRAGQALQNMLLTLEQYGFSAAIHAAIVEVSLVNKMFAASLGTTRRLTALFRAGKVKDKNNLNRPHAPRQALEEILLNFRP